MKVPLWLLDSLGYFLRQLFFWVWWNWANFRMEFFWMKQESNPGPLNYEPTRLTTRPPSRLSLCRCCLHFNFRRKQGRTDFEPKVEKQHSAFDWCKLQKFWYLIVSSFSLACLQSNRRINLNLKRPCWLDGGCILITRSWVWIPSGNVSFSLSLFSVMCPPEDATLLIFLKNGFPTLWESRIKSNCYVLAIKNNFCYTTNTLTYFISWEAVSWWRSSVSTSTFL